jgi:hypothetical protein
MTLPGLDHDLLFFFTSQIWLDQACLHKAQNTVDHLFPITAFYRILTMYPKDDGVSRHHRGPVRGGIAGRILLPGLFFIQLYNIFIFRHAAFPSKNEFLAPPPPIHNHEIAQEMKRALSTITAESQQTSSETNDGSYIAGHPAVKVATAKPDDASSLNVFYNDHSSIPGKPVTQQIPRQRARILLGIFTADIQGENRYRKKFRDLFHLHPRVCSLADFTTADSLDANSLSSFCEIIYTFVAGGNPDGPTELVDDSLPMLAGRPIASTSTDFNDSDMTLLNIRYVREWSYIRHVNECCL